MQKGSKIRTLNIPVNFLPISLEAANSAKLLNRFDSKYQLPVNKLYLILEKIQDDYFVLEINGNRIQQYETIYYDTPEDCFYTAHHNGKAGRIKIRKRNYVNSGIGFLEIKKKNNKKKTSKIRLETENLNENFSMAETEFIVENTNLTCIQSVQNLQPVGKNTFSRITLVAKTFDERCTIDLNLSFYSKNKSLELTHLAVVELKQEKPFKKTPFSVELKKHRVYRKRFSKYCLGRAMLDNALKRNLFKPAIRELNQHYLLKTNPNSFKFRTNTAV